MADLQLPEGERGGACTFSTPLGAGRHSTSPSSFIPTIEPNKKVETQLTAENFFLYLVGVSR